MHQAQGGFGFGCLYEAVGLYEVVGRVCVIMILSRISEWVMGDGWLDLFLLSVRLHVCGDGDIGDGNFGEWGGEGVGT